MIEHLPILILIKDIIWGNIYKIYYIKENTIYSIITDHTGVLTTPVKTVWSFDDTATPTNFPIPQISEPLTRESLNAFYASQPNRGTYSTGDIKYLYNPSTEYINTSYYDGNVWVSVTN